MEPSRRNKISYPLAAAAEATGFSADTLQKAMKLGELVPSYWGTKPVFEEEELVRWVKSLPNEKAS